MEIKEYYELLRKQRIDHITDKIDFFIFSSVFFVIFLNFILFHTNISILFSFINFTLNNQDFSLSFLFFDITCVFIVLLLCFIRKKILKMLSLKYGAQRISKKIMPLLNEKYNNEEIKTLIKHFQQ